MDNSQPPEILTVMRLEFGVAKRFWNIVLLAQSAMLAMGWLAPLLSFAPTWLWGVCGLVISIAAIVLKYFADQHYERGECLRRLMFRQDGLGHQPEASDLLEALASRPTRGPGEPAPIGQYFASARPMGPLRLLDNLYESSFYSYRLATRARNVFSTVCALGLLSAFILLRASAVGSGQVDGTPAAPERFGQIATEIVAFFAAGSFLEAALVYHQLARSAERVFQRCGLLERNPNGVEDVILQEAANYDCAMAKARPIPGWVYRFQRKQLDTAWKAAIQAKIQPPSPGRALDRTPGT